MEMSALVQSDTQDHVVKRKVCIMASVSTWSSLHADLCSPINPCRNGAQCSAINGVVSCTCLNGYMGTFCDIALLHIRSASSFITCANRPCQNGGLCFNDGNSFFCFCQPQWTGSTCSIEQTNSTAPTGKYACICTGPTYGVPIIFDIVTACSLNPCANGGSCFKDGSGFLCLCTAQFTGPTCTAIQATPVPTSTNPGCPESIAC